MTTIAVTPRGFRQTAGRHQALLAEHGLTPRYPAVDRPLTGDELAELVTGCSAAIVGLDEVGPAVLATDTLRAVVRFGSGVDNVDLDAARRHGVLVARTPGANAVSVAELTIALIFAVARRVTSLDRSVRHGSWRRVPGFELAGRRLGIVGLGVVGREVASRAAALGLEVVAFDPVASEAQVPLVEFDELLTTSDIISIHCPLTDSTADMFGEAALRAMRPGSVLVNTARGGIVDEAALAAVLREGHLSGAALDCFAREPLSDSELIGLDNIILTPHCAGTTQEAVERAGVTAVQEVLRALAGEPLHHRVA
ncbi:phosphoglycerate dehydrogenase [Microbispora sp. H11081]|uniref:phosphoglycerate dehydrogenase n=1 Tax=Microbispora sp. H11081 TaxID=2729107 RepID=UPI00147358F6|nr:phosphoglycerate dehydrogenase [Microbispora sp. H11081]